MKIDLVIKKEVRPDVIRIKEVCQIKEVTISQLLDSTGRIDDCVDFKFKDIFSLNFFFSESDYFLNYVDSILSTIKRADQKVEWEDVSEHLLGWITINETQANHTINIDNLVYRKEQVPLLMSNYTEHVFKYKSYFFELNICLDDNEFYLFLGKLREIKLRYGETK